MIRYTTAIQYGLGGMAEWSNAAVLKTVEAQVSGGSNPSPSANLAMHIEATLAPGVAHRPRGHDSH